MRYDIKPVPKPRMTRRDSAKSKVNRIHGMRPVVAKYWEFKNEVRLKEVFVPESGSHITFNIPMPEGWSEKKKIKTDGSPHKQTPDKDNLEKALLDAIFDQDCHIWDSRVTKRWSRKPSISINLNPIYDLKAKISKILFHGIYCNRTKDGCLEIEKDIHKAIDDVMG